MRGARTLIIVLIILIFLGTVFVLFSDKFKELFAKIKASQGGNANNSGGGTSNGLSQQQINQNLSDLSTWARNNGETQTVNLEDYYSRMDLAPDISTPYQSDYWLGSYDWTKGI